MYNLASLILYFFVTAMHMCEKASLILYFFVTAMHMCEKVQKVQHQNTAFLSAYCDLLERWYVWTLRQLSVYAAVKFMMIYGSKIILQIVGTG